MSSCRGRFFVWGSRAGTGRAGPGLAGPSRAGPGRAGLGQAGQGRARSGRAGKQARPGSGQKGLGGGRARHGWEAGAPRQRAKGPRRRAGAPQAPWPNAKSLGFHSAIIVPNSKTHSAKLVPYSIPYFCHSAKFILYNKITPPKGSFFLIAEFGTMAKIGYGIWH